jgi:hypothetical protein
MLKNIRLISKSLLLIAMVFAMSCNEDEVAPLVVIDSIESDNFYPGEDVILTGQNFNTVLFTFLDRNQVSFRLEGDNRIIITLPESQPIGSTVLTLVMADGYAETADIEVVARPFPIIQSISPSAAPAGAQVTLTGTSLADPISVTIGGAEASVVSSSATELVVTVPSGLTEGIPSELVVTTNGGEASPSSDFYVGQNLLSNGELELGSGDDFDNWGKWNGGDLMTATTAVGDAYAGRSLRAVGAGQDAWRTQFVSDEVPTVVGAEYKLLVLIKGDGGTPGVGGNIRFSTNPNALYSGNYNITGDWQQLEWTFTANSPSTRAVLDLGVVQDAVYFVDNITLLQTGTPPPPPININGSFEESDLGAADNVTGWGGLNGANASGEITDEDSHDGDKSVKMTINALGANPWDIQPTSLMDVEDGKEYTLSIWFKGRGISNIKVAIDQGGDPGYQEWAAPESSFQTNEWVEVTYDFVASTTNTSSGNARFAISMSYEGNVGGVIYIDDLEVRLKE